MHFTINNEAKISMNCIEIIESHFLCNKENIKIIFNM